jgi:hypothetical protein
MGLGFMTQAERYSSVLQRNYKSNDGGIESLRLLDVSASESREQSENVCENKGRGKESWLA